MLDQAFEALKTFDWGADRKLLAPIDEAVVAAHGDLAARKDLESRMAAALKSDISRSAKDAVCRWLMVIGTTVSVPALADLLLDREMSHLARYALERNPAPEAAQALRGALSKTNGETRIGIISSLGARHDDESTPALAKLLSDPDEATSRAAALALGDLSTAEASKALVAAKVKSGDAAIAATDARLACAEALLASGKKTEALAIYKSVSGDDQPKHVQLAGQRGRLAALKK